MTNNNLIERKKKYLFKSLNYLKQYGLKIYGIILKKNFEIVTGNIGNGTQNRQYRKLY